MADEKCPVVDAPGGRPKLAVSSITPLPGATELKAGSATRPRLGVQPALVDNGGNPLEGAAGRAAW